MSMCPPRRPYGRLRRLLLPALRGLYRLHVEGGRSLPPAGPAVLVANHESVLDPFVLGCAVERELRFLAKAELWRHRPVAWAMDGLRGIKVERGRGDREALAEARRALEQGDAVAIFPQGAVRATGPWHRGAAKLALATGAPIVPVRLLGTARALSAGRLSFPRIVVVVGEPIIVSPGPATIAGARQLTDRLRAAVESLGPSQAG
jgi:1-acyl-sn-glycerol-3-phosphate acyltransferase